MAKLSLTDEQLETMTYGDVAAYILENKGKKQKIQDLWKEVITLMHLPESDFDNKITEFFQLISTDMRFTMVEKGFWDLKVNQKHKAIVTIDDEDDEEEEIEEVEEETYEEEDDTEINYDDDNLDDDPEEDDFKDLVIIDDSDENGSNQEI